MGVVRIQRGEKTGRVLATSPLARWREGREHEGMFVLYEETCVRMAAQKQ